MQNVLKLNEESITHRALIICQVGSVSLAVSMAGEGPVLHQPEQQRAQGSQHSFCEEELQAVATANFDRTAKAMKGCPLTDKSVVLWRHLNLAQCEGYISFHAPSDFMTYTAILPRSTQNPNYSMDLLPGQCSLDCTIEQFIPGSFCLLQRPIRGME